MALVSIIDNNKLFLKMLKDMVSGQGHKTKTFSSSVLALEWLKENDCDAMVLDLVMPGLHGISLLSALKNLGRNVPPTILVTGVHESSVQKRLSGLGISSVVFKGPADELEKSLVKALKQALSGKKIQKPRLIGGKGTRQREITKELLETVRERELFLALLDEGVVAFGENLTAVFANSAAEQLLEVDRNELIGKNLLDFLCEHTEKSRASLRRLLSPPEENQSSGARKSTIQVGKKWLVLSCNHIRGKSSEIRGVLTIKDQTAIVKLNERLKQYSKSLEKQVSTKTQQLRNAFNALQATHRRMIQAEKLASLGVLSASIAHEINNPLAYLDVNLGYLQEKFLDRKAILVRDIGIENEILESIAECRDGVERIGTIVQDLQNIAKTEPERLERVNLKDVIEFTTRFTNKAIKKVATLSMEVEDIPLIQGDTKAFQQVFISVLLNAVDAFEGKRNPGNHIELKAYREDNMVTIKITDNGKGIADSILPRVFDPFFTTKDGRAGLGLSTAMALLRQHRGFLFIERTAPGKGTTVTMRLPVELKDVKEQARPEPDRPKVIFVDDDEHFLKSVKRRFRNRWNVETVLEGEAALKRIEESPNYGAIILDIFLPGMDGFEVAARIKERFSSLKNKIIFLTGSNLSQEELGESLDKFDNLVLQKPIDMDYLEYLVEETVFGAMD